MENVKEVSVHHLASAIRAKTDQVLIIDSRTFCEYNTSHVITSVNVWSSKIRKKRLQQNSMSVQDYLASACEVRRCSELCSQWSQLIVYDQSAPSLSAVPRDSFLFVLLDRLTSVFRNVQLLIGGFLEFQAQYPDCCEDATQKCSPLTSLSQPCLPVANVGPTRILPFLYLGSQHDANNRQMLQDHCVMYELNVSMSCPKPDFVQESHFLRIPVNDNFSEKLIPYFWDAFNFIDKVRESGGSVLVHCLAGISRSATVAIAYVMKHLHLPYEEAYRYVKNRRPTISPNINFVGQLLELDKHLRREGGLCDPSSAPASFRMSSSPSPYSTTVTNITNNSSSYSLDYSVNKSLPPCGGGGGGGVLSDVTSASCYSLSSTGSAFNTSACSPTAQADGLRVSNRSTAAAASASYACSSSRSSGSNVSLTHISQDQGSCQSTGGPPSAGNRPHNTGLYSRASNISTHFGKGSTRMEEARAGYTRLGCGIPRSLSLNLKSTLEAVPGSPGSTPQSPDSASVSNLNFNLMSSQSCDMSTCTPESPYRSCNSTLHSPNSQCSSLSSPMACIHSPTSALAKLSFQSSEGGRQYSPLSPSMKSLLSASYSPGSRSPTIIEVRKSPTIMENVFEAQYSTVNSTKDREYREEDDSNNNSSNQNYFSSTATISVAASPHSETNNNGGDTHGDQQEGAGAERGPEGRPRSVCIIEVNTELPVTYVDNCSSEPIIVRETEVFATPCTEADFISRAYNTASTNLPLDNNSNVHFNVNSRNSVNTSINNEAADKGSLRTDKQHKTLVPIRTSASFGSILDRPKVLELCAPIYNVKRQLSSGSGPGALVVGDCTWQTRNPDEDDNSTVLRPPSSTLSTASSAFGLPSSSSTVCSSSGNFITTATGSTQTSPTPLRTIEKSNTLGVVHDSEGTSVADSSDFNDSASEFSVMQSDSGISFQTDSESNMHHPIPRCYSSSETHLNTRRLLENSACADYSTRKSCSNDEVARSWSLHKPLNNMSSHPLPISRDSSSTSNNFAAMNNSNWNYPADLVRCDSWSTSGLGSELSDWESLQEDANSTHCDDAMGPFDAVFSDVFPGEKSDSLGSPQVYHHVFPQLFRDSSDSKPEGADGGDKKPRHHSFKDPHQRWRQQQQHKQIPLARPASLPGVMGSYLAQMQLSSESGLSLDVDDGVELRSSSGRSRGRGQQQQQQQQRLSKDSDSSSVRRNDSGYYSVTEHPAAAARTKGLAARQREPVPDDSTASQLPAVAAAVPAHRQVPVRKPLAKPQSLTLAAQRTLPYRPKPPGLGRGQTSSPPKSPSPNKGLGRHQSPSPHKSASPSNKCSSPAKSPTSQKPPSPQRSSNSPVKAVSPHKPLTHKLSSSPQPRIFGSSTFYLTQSDNCAASARTSSRKSTISESAAQKQVSCTYLPKGSQSASSIESSLPKTGQSSLSRSKNFASSTISKAAFPADKCLSGAKSVASSRSQPSLSSSGSKASSSSSSSSSRSDLNRPVKADGSSQRSSPHQSYSPSTPDSESSTETAFLNKSSSSSSRETSVESDTSIVLNKGVVSVSEAASASAPAAAGAAGGTQSTSGSRSPSEAADTPAAKSALLGDGSYSSERKSPEKRKSRSGSDDSKSKEKRRSCDLDSSLSDEQLKKPVTLKTGVRLAQELLQSMESIVSSELSEIRRCTAELSSRYRLKARARDPSDEGGTSSSNAPPSIPYRKIKHMSQFYVLPDRQQVMAAAAAAAAATTASAAAAHPFLSHSHHQQHPQQHPQHLQQQRPLKDGCGSERCRSEPPFSGDEGLYRAQSCPGLPQPLVVEERQEAVAELRPSVFRLRCDRTPPTREKLLNRYSCGTLDTQKPPATPPALDATFESCPDLGALRGRGCTSDSSSSSSSRSSFSRLLPVS